MDSTFNIVIATIILTILLIYFSNEKFTQSEDQDSININKLLRQTARWATAADQDTNPYIKNLHATYAMGYLMALREIYSDNQINSILKKEKTQITELNNQINKAMDSAIGLLVKVCPHGQPKNTFLASIAKEGAF